MCHWSCPRTLCCHGSLRGGDGGCMVDPSSVSRPYSVVCLLIQHCYVSLVMSKDLVLLWITAWWGWWMPSSVSRPYCVVCLLIQHCYVSLVMSKDLVLLWISQLKQLLTRCCHYFTILKVRNCNFLWLSLSSLMQISDRQTCRATFNAFNAPSLMGCGVNIFMTTAVPVKFAAAKRTGRDVCFNTSSLNRVLTISHNVIQYKSTM